MRRILSALLLCAAAPVLAQSPPSGSTGYVADNTVGPTAVGSLNAIVGPILATGEVGIGLVIPASSTLVGTLTPTCSGDNTTWTATKFMDAIGNLTDTLVTASGTAYQPGILVGSGCRYVRVQATGYTSGTASAILNATQVSTVPNAVAGSSTPSDAVANPTNAVPSQAHTMGWNGSTWERIWSEGGGTDAEATHTSGLLHTRSYPMLFNGTTDDRARGTIANGAAVDVTRVQGADTTTSGTISTACATGIGCAASSYVAVAALGKQGAGAQVTAISSPTGITLQCDVSMNGGTTWSEAAAGSCAFDSAKSGVKSNTINTFVVGDAYSLQGSAGERNIRVRASALTSGTVTFTVSATDTLDPSALFGSPGGATSMPPAVAVIGAQDAVTTTTVNPINSANVNTTPAAGARYLLAMPALGRSAIFASTAGNVVPLSVDTTNGGLNVRLMDSATYLSPQVAATNALATASALAVLPGIARSAISAGTAGRSTALATDVTTGFQLAHISDGATYLKQSVYANDTTAALNGAGVYPGIARATPTAVTAGRAEALQVDTATGALFVEVVPTTSAVGFSFGSGVVNTAANIKASAGSLYGAAGQNTTTTAACWLQFYNTAGSPTCGTSVVYALPLSGSAGLTFAAPSPTQLFNFATGIGVCCSTTPTGGTTCPGTCNFTVYYK
jgi:hypothetical protein